LKRPSIVTTVSTCTGCTAITDSGTISPFDISPVSAPDQILS
jgi:hypothetical protein